MSNAAIARRYAQALISANGGDALAVRSAYGELLDIYRAEPALRTAMMSPRIATAEKERVLRRLLPDAPPVLQSFLRLTFERRREAEIEAIYEEYCLMADARSGEAEATVETTVTLAEGDLERMRNALERRFGQKLRLSQKLNPSLLGGVRVRVGDRLLDDTVAARMRRVRRMLLSESELGGQA
ncbi:MAG: ATP synthase F1 subunit delta [Thermaerobacter sp.]|nr:ATP synthase F1 subunit delta [Thermaerobacter sp.]